KKLKSHEKKRPSGGDIDGYIERKWRFFDDTLPKHIHPSSYTQFAEFADLQKKYEQPILCHRLPGASSTPVTLLHPIFGQFADDCKSGRPTSEDFQFILKLSYKMSLFYNMKQEHAQ
ncbi:8632_t:CDS:1, partial [Paraglomus brasilianum]